jgi:hypothetical protein
LETVSDCGLRRMQEEECQTGDCSGTVTCLSSRCRTSALATMLWRWCRASCGNMLLTVHAAKKPLCGGADATVFLGWSSWGGCGCSWQPRGSPLSLFLQSEGCTLSHHIINNNNNNRSCSYFQRRGEDPGCAGWTGVVCMECGCAVGGTDLDGSCGAPRSTTASHKSGARSLPGLLPLSITCQRTHSVAPQRFCCPTGPGP